MWLEYFSTQIASNRRYLLANSKLLCQNVRILAPIVRFPEPSKTWQFGKVTLLSCRNLFVRESLQTERHIATETKDLAKWPSAKAFPISRCATRSQSEFCQFLQEVMSQIGSLLDYSL